MTDTTQPTPEELAAAKSAATGPVSTTDAQSFLDKVRSTAAFLTNLVPNGSTIVTAGNEVIPLISAIIGGATQIASTFFPGATIAGFAVEKALALAGALASAAPDALGAVASAQAALDGGAAPTAEQWAALDAAADAAHQSLQSAAAAFLAAHGGAA